MKTILHRALLLLLLSSGLFSSEALADESPATAFDHILERYGIVRLALTNDTTDGISEQSKEISTLLESLSSDWSSAAAGIQAEMAEEIRSLLPELREAAVALTDATSLDAARDAFYELSKPLVRWRKAADGNKPIVAYCSMAKRSWLQPEGEISNPYYGQSMLRCGETVGG